MFVGFIIFMVYYNWVTVPIPDGYYTHVRNHACSEHRQCVGPYACIGNRCVSFWPGESVAITMCHHECMNSVSAKYNHYFHRSVKILDAMNGPKKHCVVHFRPLSKTNGSGKVFGYIHDNGVVIRDVPVDNFSNVALCSTEV